jgi:uncharacterized protein (DUF3084 family)
LIEIEKKDAEIENLKKQVDQANTERNMLKEELLKLAEDQESTINQSQNLKFN